MPLNAFFGVADPIPYRMSKTAELHPDIERVLLSEDELRARVAELGRQISQDYAGRSPVLVGILKGSVIFMADLMRSIRLSCPVDFISLASYSGRASTGV